MDECWFRMVAALVALMSVGNMPVHAQARTTEYFNPVWSPDGRSIAFEILTDSGRYTVATVRADGTHLDTLTTGPHDDHGPAFSADGKRIVFTSNRDGHAEVYVMDRDGAHQRRVTTGMGTTFVSGTFSPDGREIAVMGRGASATAAVQLYVVRVDGTNLRALTDSTLTVRDARWSPEGSRILLTARPSVTRDWIQLTPVERDSIIRRTELWVVRPDGTRLRRLTTNDDVELGAAWTASGASVTYQTYRGDPRALHRLTIAADTTGATQRDETFPVEGAFAPDGRSLAYTKRGAGNAGLYVRDITTGQERRIVGAP